MIFNWFKLHKMKKKINTEILFFFVLNAIRKRPRLKLQVRQIFLTKGIWMKISTANSSQ